MNGINFVADTNFLLYILEGKEEAVPYLDYRFAVSVISEIELLGWHKISNEEITQINNLISSCVLIELTTSIRKKAIEMRQQSKIRTADAIILATAYEMGLPLLTADKCLAQFKGVEIILLS